MMWIFWLVMAAIAIPSLGLSINLGVAAERFKLTGHRRNQAFAVILSIVCAAVALYCAFLIGTTWQPSH